jgi:hypothetical protein
MLNVKGYMEYLGIFMQHIIDSVGSGSTVVWSDVLPFAVLGMFLHVCNEQ